MWAGGGRRGEASNPCGLGCHALWADAVGRRRRARAVDGLEVALTELARFVYLIGGMEAELNERLPIPLACSCSESCLEALRLQEREGTSKIRPLFYLGFLCGGCCIVSLRLLSSCLNCPPPSPPPRPQGGRGRGGRGVESGILLQQWRSLCQGCVRCIFSLFFFVCTSRGSAEAHNVRDAAKRVAKRKPSAGSTCQYFLYQ